MSERRRQIPVLDAEQAACWDRTAREVGSPSRVLMESAGRASAHVIARHFGRFERGLLVAVGHGNNGGDGWVIARALHAVGIPVWVAEYARERTPDCEANRELALRDGVSVLTGDSAWPNVDVVVDALLGTGAAGAPRGPVGQLADRLMKSNASVVAVDGPTGLDLTTGEAFGSVRADLTVTFGGFRRGHLLRRDWCGRIVVLDIGFGVPPADANWPRFVDDGWARDTLPRFTPEMHKGDRGRVLIVGGEDGMAGAVHYAAMAAFASGAGLVRLATQEGSAVALQKNFPDSTVLRTELGPQVEEGLKEALSWADAVVVGPGLGRGSKRSRFVAEIVHDAVHPVVLDADALHIGIDNLNTGAAPRVFTPHVGEFKVMFPDVTTVEADRFGAVRAAARNVANAERPVLLKGVPTLIAAGDVVSVVASGNPGLATGGSGDVLSGIIGAFLARGLTPVDAAMLGAHALGRAAEVRAQEVSVRSIRPSMIVESLSDVWKVWSDVESSESEQGPPVLLDLPLPRLT